MRSVIVVLSLVFSNCAFAQSKVETFKGDWKLANGQRYNTCIFEIEAQSIKQKCNLLGSLKKIDGAKFEGNTITLPKILVGKPDEGYTILRLEGDTLKGQYVRSDGRQGASGIFVKQ